jgi:hypothetical protein
MAYRPIVLEAARTFPLAAGELWDGLADTDRLDRVLGMPAVAYGTLTVTADAMYREASARLGVFRSRWREYPFEWVRGERYGVLRLFELGPLDVFYGGVRLGPAADGTQVTVFAELTPRHAVGWLLARLLGRKGIRRVFEYCAQLSDIRTQGRDLAVPEPGAVTPTNPAVLEPLLAGLQAHAPRPLLQRFARHLAAAADREVLRMQPYGLAAAWGAQRGELLRLFARAERQGGLYHSWEVMCPNCRVSQRSAPRIEAVPSRFHCDTCGIEYGADLARCVELRYSVHPLLRPARDEVYCLGGPATAPHVFLQQYLLPGTERRLVVELPEDALRARVLRRNDTCPLDPEGGAAKEVGLTYRPDGWQAMRRSFCPGRVSIRLRNETPQVVVVVVERAGWDPLAITAAQVLELPEFREVREAEQASRDVEPGRAAPRA